MIKQKYIFPLETAGNHHLVGLRPVVVVTMGTSEKISVLVSGHEMMYTK